MAFLKVTDLKGCVLPKQHFPKSRRFSVLKFNQLVYSVLTSPKCFLFLNLTEQILKHKP